MKKQEMDNSTDDNIYGYQWSAILDKDTCNYCRSMDGKVISATDKRFHEYQPGRVHSGCRCIWVAILKDETKPPAFTGIPEELRPQTEVPSEDFQDLDAPLPGSSKMGVKERLYSPKMIEEQEALYGKHAFEGMEGGPDNDN